MGKAAACDITVLYPTVLQKEDLTMLQKEDLTMLQKEDLTMTKNGQKCSDLG